jgi:hypothetical protein
MGMRYPHEAIRNVRSTKGIYSGCEITKSAANTLNMSAGRVKFGQTAANITANNGQFLNEGGTQQSVSATSLNTAALADGIYSLFLRTDGTIDTTAETKTNLDKGPLVTLNNVGTSTSPNVTALDFPSIRLGSFTKSAGDVVAASINYDGRETIA